MRTERFPTFVAGFPERLQEAMEQKELNNCTLARKIKCNRHTIMRYKSGDASPDIVIFMRLCAALKVSPNWLLTGKE